MTKQAFDFEAVYAVALRRAAQRENIAVFGPRHRAPTPEAELRMADVWRTTFDVLTDQPATVRDIAALSGQHAETARKHLYQLRRIGAALNGPKLPMPQGGFSSTWIKGKEPQQ